jgi:hypothetical protein
MFAVGSIAETGKNIFSGQVREIIKNLLLTQGAIKRGSRPMECGDLSPLL